MLQQVVYTINWFRSLSSNENISLLLLLHLSLSPPLPLLKMVTHRVHGWEVVGRSERELYVNMSLPQPYSICWQYDPCFDMYPAMPVCVERGRRESGVSGVSTCCSVIHEHCPLTERCSCLSHAQTLASHFSINAHWLCLCACYVCNCKDLIIIWWPRPHLASRWCHWGTKSEIGWYWFLCRPGWWGSGGSGG